MGRTSIEATATLTGPNSLVVAHISADAYGLDITITDVSNEPIGNVHIELDSQRRVVVRVWDSEQFHGGDPNATVIVKTVDSPDA